MTQQTLYEQLLRNLRDPAIPVHVRYADERTLKATAKRLAELLQPKPPIKPTATFVSLSADKYD